MPGSKGSDRPQPVPHQGPLLGKLIYVKPHLSPMKTSTVALLALLLLTNGAWVYREIDHAVTEGYRRGERYENANRLVAASTLATEAVRGRSRVEVEALLHRLFPTEESFVKDGSLHTVWLEMPLGADGAVTGVAIDSGTTEEARAAIVGNEVFYPMPASAGSGR